MRFSTSGELGRVDVAPVMDLLPALRDEWASLQFARDGSLVNPLTLQPVGSFFLAHGRHREVGARYRITITTPEMDLPEERRAEFERESRKLSQRNAKRDAWNDHFARRREASVQDGTNDHPMTATLFEDTIHRLAFTLADDSERWTIEIDIEHHRLPIVSLSGTLELTALLRADGTPGCLAEILGGSGDGAAVLDLAPLEDDGRMIDTQGRANRLRGSLQLATRTSATRWELDGKGALHARGLARPILWFAGRRMRRSIDQSLTEFWTASGTRMRELNAEMHRLRSAIEEAGGQAPFVRRVLWDDDYEPGFDAFRQGRS